MLYKKSYYFTNSYLIKSKARTVPSRDADMTNFLLGPNTTSVTELVCSENVTKQNPD